MNVYLPAKFQVSSIALTTSPATSKRTPTKTTQIRVNQYAEQKTLTDVLVASLLVLDLSCLRKLVLPYRLKMIFCVFMKR